MDAPTVWAVMAIKACLRFVHTWSELVVEILNRGYVCRVVAVEVGQVCKRVSEADDCVHAPRWPLLRITQYLAVGAQ